MMESKTNLKALYEQFEKEDMQRAARKSNKGYTAEDIRRSIKKVFMETNQDTIRTNVLVKLIQKMEGGIPDVKYQEVRSTVKGKKLEGFELGLDDQEASVVRMV